MDEAAPQAAAGADTDEVAKALEVLRLRGELDYLTGYDNEHGWWASRRGVVGHILMADSPEELGQIIGDDFGTATPGSLAHKDRITEPWT